jgi:hypothetical protein
MFVSSTATSLDLLTLDPLPPETRQRLLRFPLGLDESALLPLGADRGNYQGEPGGNFASP